MKQKVLKIGNSAAITIPKKSLPSLGCSVGDEVNVVIDPKNKIVTIHFESQVSSEDQRVARLTADFIDRYRSDLTSLSRK